MTYEQLQENVQQLQALLPLSNETACHVVLSMNHTVDSNNQAFLIQELNEKLLAANERMAESLEKIQQLIKDTK